MVAGRNHVIGISVVGRARREDLDLEVGRHNYENDTAECQTVNDRRHLVGLSVSGQVLDDQKFHGFALPLEKGVDHSELNHSLNVECDQCQAENHPDQNKEKCLEQEAQVEIQDRRRQDVVNQHATERCDKASDQIGQLLFKALLVTDVNLLTLGP